MSIATSKRKRSKFRDLNYVDRLYGKKKYILKKQRNLRNKAKIR